MGDTAKRCTENESLDAPQLVLQTVHELDQKSAVTIHRAANIAQKHDLGFLDAPLAVRHLDHFTTEFHTAPHRGTRIDHRPFAADLLAPAYLGGDLRGDE